MAVEPVYYTIAIYIDLIRSILIIIGLKEGSMYATFPFQSLIHPLWILPSIVTIILIINHNIKKASEMSSICGKCLSFMLGSIGCTFGYVFGSVAMVLAFLFCIIFNQYILYFCAYTVKYEPWHNQMYGEIQHENLLHYLTKQALSKQMMINKIMAVNYVHFTSQNVKLNLKKDFLVQEWIETEYDINKYYTYNTISWSDMRKHLFAADANICGSCSVLSLYIYHCWRKTLNNKKEPFPWNITDWIVMYCISFVLLIVTITVFIIPFIQIFDYNPLYIYIWFGVYVFSQIIFWYKFIKYSWPSTLYAMYIHPFFIQIASINIHNALEVMKEYDETYEYFCNKSRLFIVYNTFQYESSSDVVARQLTDIVMLYIRCQVKGYVC